MASPLLASIPIFSLYKRRNATLKEKEQTQTEGEEKRNIKIVRFNIRESWCLCLLILLVPGLLHRSPSNLRWSSFCNNLNKKHFNLRSEVILCWLVDKLITEYTLKAATSLAEPNSCWFSVWSFQFLV